MKQIVGESAYDLAVTRINSKFDMDDPKRAKHSDKIYQEDQTGTLDQFPTVDQVKLIMDKHIKRFEKTMRETLRSYSVQIQRFEDVFQDKMDNSGSSNFTAARKLFPDSSKRKKYSELTPERHSMPNTINLPEMPLVRVQDRRVDQFDSTLSSMGEVPSASDTNDAASFRKRRRTLQHMDSADQKIPGGHIAPIDETEEFGLRGSISIDEDQNNGKRSR